MTRSGKPKDREERPPVVSPPGQEDEDPEEQLYTWPHLVAIEGVAATTFFLSLLLMAVFINAPLAELADPQNTPNPSKAPWYFLSLQELLLHMNPSLAGVIVPGAVLTGLAAIPYLERDESDTAIWFAGEKGIGVAKFSAVYTTVILVLLVLYDEWFGVSEQVGALGLPSGLVGEIIIPAIIMGAVFGVLAGIIKLRFNGNLRHIVIGMFTVFLTSYIVLTIIGTAFRGEGMQLFWPWMAAGHG